MKIILPYIFILMLTTNAAAEPPALPLPWVKLSEIYYTPSQARMYGADGISQPPYNAVYVQTHLDVPYGPQQTDTPILVDLVPFGIAEDAKVAWLAGVLIITRGTTYEIADLHVTFAAAGAPIDCTKYIGQVVEAQLNGQRSTMSVMVPLTNGKFQFCYHLSTGGSYPTNSAYAINLSLQAWGR